MGNIPNSVIVSEHDGQTTFEMIAVDTDPSRWQDEMRRGAWRPYRAKFDWNSVSSGPYSASNASHNFFRWIVKDIHSTFVDTIRIRQKFVDTDSGMTSCKIESIFSEEFAFDDAYEFLTILGILLYNHKNGGECYLLQDGYPNGVNYFFVRIPEGLCRIDCVYGKDSKWELGATLCDGSSSTLHTHSVRVFEKGSKWYYSAFLRNRRRGDL